MKTIWKRLVAFTIIYAFLSLRQGLQADDGPHYYRPTVHVSVTATGNGPLHYQWRATDGSIQNLDEPNTTWTLPSGPGLHYAYVLVSDHKGGYTEGRVAVDTDALGTAPESFASEPMPLNAPAAPARVGDTYRGQLGYQFSIPGCDSDYCDVFAPGVKVYLQDSNGVRYPPTGTVSTDALGYFTVAGVPPIGFTIYCNLVDSSVFASCGNDSIGSSAYTDYSTYTPVDEGFDAGSVSLADGSLCGTSNELFGVHRAARVTLLDANGKPLATVPVDGLGNYTFAASVANAVTAQFSCESAARLSQPILLGYLANGSLPGTGAPVINAMTAPLNGNPGVFLPEVGVADFGDGFPADSTPSTQRRNNFLAFKGLDSRKAACRYYKAIGAVQGCGENGELEGAVSYRDWQRSVHIGRFVLRGGVKAHATYVNKVDLNLTRVQDSVRYGTTSLATVVCNHKGPTIQVPNDVLNPSTGSVDQAVGDAIAGRNLIACVAMDYQLNPGVNGNKKFVRFYIFGPSGQLLPSVNLDGRGEKFMPGSCVSCHGGEHYAGHYPEDGTGSADFGGHMLPYDKGNFEFSNVDGLSDAQREEAIYALNQNLLAVDPPATPQVEGALTVAAQNLITGWYSNPSLAAHQLDQNYIPTAWQTLIGNVSPDWAVEDSLFYRRVIARTCRTCHVNQGGYDFEDPNAYLIGNESSVQRATCGGGSHHVARWETMPNSVVTFNRYWLSQGTTDPATGESTDMPQIMSDFYGDNYCGDPPYIY